jgi:DNA-directed RNA polymerase subunit RPC12/RpoP
METTKKVKCKHCGSEHHCFEEQTNLPSGDEALSYLCISCGYTTTTLNKVDSEMIAEYESVTAQLIKDIRWIDDEGLVWYPIVLNFPSTGIIFPDGHSASDWHWVAAKAIDIPENEQQRFPVVGREGEFYKRRIDMENKEQYPKDNFYEACKSIGFILSDGAF